MKNRKNKKTSINRFFIRSTQLKLLERLSNASSVSGNEDEVREIVLEEIKDHTDTLKIDSIGNVLAICHAKKSDSPKVMVAAHMDEVGFMVTDEGENGLFRFEKIGGIPNHYIVGKSVLVGSEKLRAVVGTKPIHLVKNEELEKRISLESLRIDLGSEGTKKACPGDYVTFATKFKKQGSSLMGKAIDNRIGVATLIELIKNPPQNIELRAAFTVQEELGLRGAGVAAYSMEPDIAFVLDATPANDLPVWDKSENTNYNTRLDSGPAIYIADSATLSDPRLIKLIIQTASENGIPYQLRQPGGGGTDAGAIHKQRSGIPTVSISVPTRYIHTPMAIVRIKDWENSVRLIRTTLGSIDTDFINRTMRHEI